MYITLNNGRKVRMPSDEEDAVIHAAALSDPDNLPLTEEELARMRPAREVMPPALYAALTDKSKPPIVRIVTDAEDAARQAAKRSGRPPLASPKKRIAIRLDADVLEGLRATGAGWQTRVNTLLRKAVLSRQV